MLGAAACKVSRQFLSEGIKQLEKEIDELIVNEPVNIICLSIYLPGTVL